MPPAVVGAALLDGSTWRCSRSHHGCRCWRRDSDRIIGTATSTESAATGHAILSGLVAGCAAGSRSGCGGRSPSPRPPRAPPPSPVWSGRCCCCGPGRTYVDADASESPLSAGGLACYRRVSVPRHDCPSGQRRRGRLLLWSSSVWSPFGARGAAPRVARTARPPRVRRAGRRRPCRLLGRRRRTPSSADSACRERPTRAAARAVAVGGSSSAVWAAPSAAAVTPPTVDDALLPPARSARAAHAHRADRRLSERCSPGAT